MTDQEWTEYEREFGPLDEEDKQIAFFCHKYNTMQTKVVGFNDEWQVFVDQQGLPLDNGTLTFFVMHGLQQLHVYNKLEIEMIARKLAEKNCPNMVDQLDWEYFTRGYDETNGIADLQFAADKGLLYGS